MPEATITLIYLSGGGSEAWMGEKLLFTQKLTPGVQRSVSKRSHRRYPQGHDYGQISPLSPPVFRSLSPLHTAHLASTMQLRPHPLLAV